MRPAQGCARAAQGTFIVFGLLNVMNALSVLKRERKSADKANGMRHLPDNMPAAIMDKGRRLSPGITNHHLKYRWPQVNPHSSGRRRRVRLYPVKPFQFPEPRNQCIAGTRHRHA